MTLPALPHALPPSLALKTIAWRRARPADVQARRAAFARVAKPAFLRHLAALHAPALAAMGISPRGIDRMQDGELPRNNPGEQLDCSIDHIVSLTFGGTNDFENLMMIPARINALKNDLETSQLAPGQTEGTLTTIMPARDGTPVPFVEGGFQRLKSLHHESY